MFREPERALVSCCACSFNTHGTGMLEPQLIGKYGKSYGSETLKWSGSVHFIRHSWSAPLPGGKQLLQTFPIGVLIEGLAGYSAGWATSDPHAQDMTSHVFRFLHTQVPQTHTHTHTPSNQTRIERPDINHTEPAPRKRCERLLQEVIDPLDS